MIQNIIGHKKNIIFDKDYPDGTPRKLLDSKKFVNWDGIKDIFIRRNKKYLLKLLSKKILLTEMKIDYFTNIFLTTDFIWKLLINSEDLDFSIYYSPKSIDEIKTVKMDLIKEDSKKKLFPY